ncbi:MAG: Hsp20 family protein [Candidatus Eremiobacteraeota bacterium]|nr:Hsp20 family protein [Candidatus Eremiobacteraeota bacterium]MBV8499530.1 Hsp20 family protein [Candidatus Eremiobacteraeota bacterium]
MSDLLVRNAGRNAATRMVPWTPFRDLLGFDPFQSLRSNWAFEYDVRRTEAGYEVEVPVPGLRPDDVEVTYQDGIVAVNGKAERRAFSRSFTVPEDVDADAIEARVNDGMLVLTLARRPEAQPKRIAVK